MSDCTCDKSDKLKRVYNTVDAIRGDLISGVDPLSGVIMDRSIARTFAICDWQIKIYSEFELTNPRITEYNVTHSNNPNLNKDADQQSSFNVLAGHIFRYGWHQITLTPYASYSNTDHDRTFLQYVYVEDMPPCANFDAIDAYTVDSSYSVNDGPPLSRERRLPIQPDNTVHNGTITTPEGTFPFISGYAPHLRIAFKDKSLAHTFPISKYEWDFGDIYNEGPSNIYDPQSNYYTVIAQDITQGLYNRTFGDLGWRTDATNHIAEHTYIMPGTYDVTLTTSASVTNSSDTCAKYISPINETGKFYIHLEEIKPQCGSIQASLTPNLFTFTSNLSTLKSVTPTIVYFKTNIEPGSFPLCIMEWKVGNHTETIFREPLSTHTSQGLPLIKINPTKSIFDLTNYMVPILVDSSDPGGVDVSVTAYTCNTNTRLICDPCGNPEKRFYNIPLSANKIVKIQDLHLYENSRFCTNVINNGTIPVETPLASYLSGITPQNTNADITYTFNLNEYDTQLLTNVTLSGYHRATNPSFDDLVTIKVGNHGGPLNEITNSTALSTFQITSNYIDIKFEMLKVGSAIDFGPLIYGIQFYISESVISPNAPCNNKLNNITQGLSSANIETKKLIASRIDDKGNLIYMFEGQNEGHIYTVALTGEATN